MPENVKSKENLNRITTTFEDNPNLLEADRLVTEQDKTLYSLCRPERLLELAWKYTVFDGGIKKVARYQQYFVTKSTLSRLKHFESILKFLSNSFQKNITTKLYQNIQLLKITCELLFMKLKF